MRCAMKILGLILFSIGVIGCASLGRRELQSPYKISLEEVESIRYGKTSSDSIEQRLGKPDLVFSLDAGTEIWGYEAEYPDVGRSQRLNLSIDSRSKKVVGAAWIPRPEEPLFSKEKALLKYPGAKPVLEDPSVLKKHYRDSDLVYSDVRAGVEILVNPVTRAVYGISFSQSSDGRKPSQE